MRAVRLAKVAAQAEGLRLRRLVRRLAKRAAFGAVAAAFGLAALVLLHVLVFLALVDFAGMLGFWAALIVLGLDVVFAGLFGLREGWRDGARSGWAGGTGGAGGDGVTERRTAGAPGCRFGRRRQGR